jgi:hypothetical protein
MIQKIALLLLIGFTSISICYADSPLTSTRFSEAYSTEPIIVKAGKTDGLLTQELFNFLVDDTKAIDLKMALINKLSWSIDGKDNAGLFLSFVKKTKKWKDYTEFMEAASAEEQLCYAYLKALDDYFDVSVALEVAEIAVSKNPYSYTFNIIHALIQAQSIFEEVDRWCEIYIETSNVRLEETLEKDMKIESEDIIFEYLNLYAEYCEETEGNDYEEDVEYVEEPYDDAIESELDELSIIMAQLFNTVYFQGKATEEYQNRIIEAGGSGFDLLLEGCPDPDTYGCMDISESYDFVFIEIYPDRNVTVDRFSYFPETGIFMLYVPEDDTYVSFPEE